MSAAGNGHSGYDAGGPGNSWGGLGTEKADSSEVSALPSGCVLGVGLKICYLGEDAKGGARTQGAGHDNAIARSERGNGVVGFTRRELAAVAVVAATAVVAWHLGGGDSELTDPGATGGPSTSFLV